MSAMAIFRQLRRIRCQLEPRITSCLPTTRTSSRCRKIKAARRHYGRTAPMKLRLSSCLLLVAFLVPFPISAQQALPPVIDGQVDRLAAEEMASLHEPSLAISIVNDGQLIFAKGYGVSDVENNVPATADTVYLIASLSKSL